MLTKIYDIAYAINAAGNLQLEQDMGCGEVARIDLHPIHVQFFASEMGMTGEGSVAAWEQVATLSRRLCLLRDRMEVLHDMLLSIPCYPPGADDNSKENLYSEASLELAREYCEPSKAMAGPLPVLRDTPVTSRENQVTPRNAKTAQQDLLTEGQA